MSIIVEYFDLILKDTKECLGKRYIIKTKFSRWSKSRAVLDFPVGLNEAEGYLYSFLINYDCKPEYNGNMYGVIENDCYITKDWSEKIAVEVQNKEHLKQLLQGVFVQYVSQLKVYESLKNNFGQYCNSILRLLRTNGVEVMSNEVEQDANRLEMCIRFLGGFSNWEGGRGDICDADTLSFKVSKAVNEVVKEFNSLNKENIELYWETGEKAYTYFFFKILD